MVFKEIRHLQLQWVHFPAIHVHVSVFLSRVLNEDLLLNRIPEAPMVVCILTGCFLADNSAKMRPELVELPVQLGVIPKGPIFHVWFLRLVSSCQDFANTNKHPLEFQIWDVHTI